MAEDRELLHTREKVVQQMSRDGLIEENITQGTVQNISKRQADFLFSGEETPQQAHDRSQNRIYYQHGAAGTEKSEWNASEPALPTGNEATLERAAVPGNASVTEHAAPSGSYTDVSPPVSGMEPEAWEEWEDISGVLPEEFASFANRIAQINSESGGNSEEGLYGGAARKAEELLEHKNQKLKKETGKEAERKNSLLRYRDEGEGEEEESNGEEESEESGKKKPENEKQEKNKRLRQEDKELLKFQEEKEPEEEERLQKRRKRLRFEEEAEEGEAAEEEREAGPTSGDGMNGRKEKKKDGGEEEEESDGRLKFEEDDVRGASFKGRAVKAVARKAIRRFEEEQEEDQLGKGALRDAKYLDRKRRLGKLHSQIEESEEGNGRLREKGSGGNKAEGRMWGDERGKRRLQDKSAVSVKLKNGSRYLKGPEKKNRKKEYQRKISHQKSMEIAQGARKNSEFVKAAKAAAVKAAAALKGSVAVLVIVLLLFAAIFLMAGYVLFGLLHMGEAGIGAIYGGLYQSTYSDISDCEAYFRERETDLEERIAHIEDEEAYAGCYEYIYDLGHIGHRAVELISYLAAKYTDFTLEMCQGELDALFEERYTLQVEIKEEPRERTKTGADGHTIYDADGSPVKETFLAEICYVTLTVKPWDEIMESRMTPEEIERYRVYLMSQGGQQVYGNPLLENWQDKISSPFGYRIHPITKEKTLHKGVDIAVPVGTPLFSCTAGTVVTARYSDSAGNFIEVVTESGYMVRYLHLDSLGVSAGDSVETGMLIGATGNTGRSTGPHLHLEVRTPDGNPIDPTFIIANGEGREEEAQEE